MAIRSENAVDKFITRWQSASGSERANYQLFVHELCTLLELPTPDPAREDTRDKTKGVSIGLFFPTTPRTMIQTNSALRFQF